MRQPTNHEPKGEPDLRPQLEMMAAAVWPDVIRLIDQAVERSHHGNWGTPSRGSCMWRDDELAKPYQTNHAVQMLLTAGIDALGGIRHLIWGRPNVDPAEPVLHQAAHYVLARAAIENFATGIWMLEPRSRTVRIERTLRWHVRNVQDQHKALDRIDPSGRPQEEKLLQLEAIAAKAFGDKPAPKIRGGYRSTDVVTYVDETDPGRGAASFLPTLTLWQLCSGFAHGRPWAGLTFNDREMAPTDDPEVMSLRLTSNLNRSLIPPKRAVELYSRLLVLCDRRVRPPH